MWLCRGANVALCRCSHQYLLLQSDNHLATCAVISANLYTFCPGTIHDRIDTTTDARQAARTV